MRAAPGRVLLLFLDGVGIGEDDARTNPLVRANLSVLRGLLGGLLPVRSVLGAGEVRGAGEGWVAAADATLGVPGLPQSGTGQTTLLTGVNGAERIGRHFGPWVPTGLRSMLAAENLLSRARAAGRSAAFANAYPEGWAAARAHRRPAAPPLAAQAAGLLTRHESAVRAGRGVVSEITNVGWRKHLDPEAPLVTPADAGRILAGISAEAEVTLFAHYDTDHVGHRKEMEGAVKVLERVDSFLGGLVPALPADALLVIASDHGNVEDATVGHTTNPVPVIAYGPGSEALARRVRSIADVTPAILELLRIDRGEIG
jgi:hypothetical protein